jgi:hypothetical protein
MKKPFLIFIITVFLSNILFSQNQKIENDSIKYFDENYNPISKMEFENRKYLDSLLSKSANRKIDSTKPLVILYYPGKDPCNSSGTATRRTKKSWYNKMEKGINKIKESNILYIYKNDNGLIDGFKEWIKDPEQTIERLFFKRHYPCSSFVVISEKNEFISYFGEFSKEYVWKAVEIITNE